jgi:hypothetical protein
MSLKRLGLIKFLILKTLKEPTVSKLNKHKTLKRYHVSM